VWRTHSLQPTCSGAESKWRGRGHTESTPSTLASLALSLVNSDGPTLPACRVELRAVALALVSITHTHTNTTQMDHSLLILLLPCAGVRPSATRSLVIAPCCRLCVSRVFCLGETKNATQSIYREHYTLVSTHSLPL
jgi:hypothetical protein